MSREILRIWPLFLGLFVIGLVVGSQGSLLGIRSTQEGFSQTWVGIVMTAYFAGFLIGSTTASTIIRRVGHVRAFAALTAVASITILVHPLFVEPWLWALMRLGSGFAMSGIYVVSESWLNRASDEKSRGQVLSLYMVTVFSGMIAGQFLLNIADPGSYVLFSLISVLVSFAAIPMLVSTAPTPPVEVFDKIKISKLLKWAPYGVIGSFLANICFGAVMGMAAVYGVQMGLGVFEVSVFVSAILAGNAILQWPLGRLSDMFDRRKVVAIIAAVASLLAMLASQTRPDSWQGVLLAGLFGGFCLALYALFIALTNDYMKPEKILPASGTLVLISGLGSICGPLMTSISMKYFGPQSFYWTLSGVLALTALVGLYRILFRPFSPYDSGHEFSIYAPTTMGTNLRVHDESETPEGVIAERESS